MATCRKNVPIRESDGEIRIDAGTMCRMPSPLPGPLRGESGRERSHEKDALASNFSGPGSFTLSQPDETSSGATPSGARAKTVAMGRVA